MYVCVPLHENLQILKNNAYHRPQYNNNKMTPMCTTVKIVDRGGENTICAGSGEMRGMRRWK